MGEPTLEKVAQVICPDEKPYKCGIYGICYGYEHYCDQAANDIVSCFPSSLKGEGETLDWCYQFLRGEVRALHPMCEYACHRRFNSTFCSNLLLGSSQELWNPLTAVGWILSVILLVVILCLVYKFCFKAKPQRGRTTFRRKAVPPEEPPSPDDDSDASDDVDRRKDRKIVPSHSETTVTTEDTTTPLQPSGGRSESKKNPEDQRPLLPDQAITLRHSNSNLAGGHSQQYGQDDDRSSSSSAATGHSSSSSSSSGSTPQDERENGRHSPSTSSTGQGSEESARGQNASDAEGSAEASPAERDQRFLRGFHLNQTQPDSDGNHTMVTSGAPYQYQFD